MMSYSRRPLLFMFLINRDQFKSTSEPELLKGDIYKETFFEENSLQSESEVSWQH